MVGLSGSSYREEMTEQGGGFGPAEPAASTTAPFSVTGPTTTTLDGARTGTASFVVTNVSGRPLRARLLPQPLAGADASWLTLVGDMERPLGVAATLTAEVRVAVPDDVPAGEHALRLDVAAEDRPDQVTTGQSVAFTVSPPRKRPVPRWLLVLVVAGVLALLVGGWLVWRAVAGPGPGPLPLGPPTLTGSPAVGETLEVTPGTWDAEVELVHVWQSCPVEATDDDPTGCADVAVEVDGTTVTATGTSFVVGADHEGRRLRVVERALTGAALEGGDLGDQEIPGQASALTAVVEPPPVTTAEVPAVVGLRQSQAAELVAARGLVTVVTRVGAGGECDPVVTAQSSPAGSSLPIGSPLGLVTLTPPPFTTCLGILDGPFFHELPLELHDDFRLVLPGSGG